MDPLFVPLGEGPWLRDRTPAVRGKWWCLGGAGAILASGLLGSAGAPALAGGLLLSGVLALLAGFVTWIGHSLGPAAVQVCPRCRTRSERGATTCRGCRFTPRRRA
jgi:hypothetical protein